jgi:hypothetical protein
MTAAPLDVLVAVRLARVVGACAPAIFTPTATMGKTPVVAVIGSAELTALVLGQLGLLGLHCQFELGQTGSARGAAASVSEIVARIFSLLVVTG